MYTDRQANIQTNKHLVNYSWHYLLQCSGTFESPDVTHVEGDIDAVRDLNIIREELRLKDEEYIVKELDRLEKVVTRGGDKKRGAELECMHKLNRIVVEEKKYARFADWNEREVSKDRPELICIILV